MVRHQFAKLRPSNGSCGFDPHALRHKNPKRKFGVLCIMIRLAQVNPKGAGPRARPCI